MLARKKTALAAGLRSAWCSGCREHADFVPWTALRDGSREFPHPVGADLGADHLTPAKASPGRVYWAQRALTQGQRGCRSFIIRREDESLLGAITLGQHPPRPRANLRRWATGSASPLHGQGYMREAIEAVVHLRLSRAGSQPGRGRLPAGKTSPRAGCSKRPGSNTRAWRKATSRSMGAGATTCSTPPAP